jgi:hypothetical protein
MENYILRVYRRDIGYPHKIAGTLEFVGKNEKKNFTSFDELKALLGCENDSFPDPLQSGNQEVERE